MLSQMPGLNDGGPRDPAWELVETKLRMLAGKHPVELFGKAVRQAIDEVIDGPRTGRWSLEQLEKTEKTYVGTKVEIVVRTTLGLERGPVLDFEIEHHPVDVKWAMNSQWQIPREAVGQLCLCIGGLENLTRFQVGLVRCHEEYLNRGKNRDSKRTLSTKGREAMGLLVPSSPLPVNFVERMDHVLRITVMEEPSIQKRVTRLFKLLPRTPIPRNAVATVARTTGDPMRRVRADSHREDPLAGMKILSARYDNAVVAALGYPPLAADEFMSVPAGEISRLPTPEREKLAPAIRRRLDLD
jgi:hypothetical protein